MNVALPIETTETNCNFCGSHDDQLMFEGPIDWSAYRGSSGWCSVVNAV